MNVLALSSYPVEAAATRYRLTQFVKPLAERGIELSISPFVDSKLFSNLYRKEAWLRTFAGLAKSTLRRGLSLSAIRRADVILIQREAMLFGPPLIEWMITHRLKRPMVLDLDDATYVSYDSPTYGRLTKFLKWFEKTDDLIRWASIVTCGNRSIAEYVESKGARARVIPTVVDNEIFKPAARDVDRVPVLGWIGTHSTFPYLESTFPVLSALAKECDFRLKIVGAGRDEITVPGVEVESLKWSLDREVADFQSIDIGLYPIDASLYSDKWAQGKSGFKAVQYLAVGVPFVATPVGGSADIGVAGQTHFFASDYDEWYRNLEWLITHPQPRCEMGNAGRAFALAHYGLDEQADKLASALRDAASQNY